MAIMPRGNIPQHKDRYCSQPQGLCTGLTVVLFTQRGGGIEWFATLKKKMPPASGALSPPHGGAEETSGKGGAS